MIPFILAAVGGYLIGDSMKDSQTFADGGVMAYGGFITKDEMNKIEQNSYQRAVMKGISIIGSLDGITFSTRNEYLAINLAKSFADIGYNTKVVSIGGGENYVVWVRSN